MGEIISIYNAKKNYSGIYKLNFPNGKCYIGQSKNIIRRIREHNCSNKQYAVSKAIQKYGKREEFELLEEISPEKVEYINERERYYINFYNSTVHNNGYNITLGGDGALRDFENPIVQFIKQELLKNEKSIQEIAEEAGVGIWVVSNINNGHTYKEDKYEYPLKKKNVYHSQCLKEHEIKEIIELLRNNHKIKMSDIGEKYFVPEGIIQSINKGESPYHYSNQDYPIRQKNANFEKFTKEEIFQIIHLLKTTDITQIEIANQFKCSRDLIGKINSGKAYYNENEEYPIRKTRVKKGKENNFIGEKGTYNLKAIKPSGEVYICNSLADLAKKTGINRNTGRQALFSGKPISQGKYKDWKIIPLTDEEYKELSQQQ